MTDTSAEADATEQLFFPGVHAPVKGDAPAITMAQSGQSMTYSELDAMANRISHLLRAANIQRGDHVAMCMENRLEFLAICWGFHYAGVHYTAISSRLTSEEMAYIVNDCGAQAFITSPYKAADAAAIVADTPNVKVRLSVGGTFADHESFEDAIAEHPGTPLENRRETTDMLYSSGTTGRPKGVKTPAPDEPLGTANGLLQLCALLFSIDGECQYLSPAPLYHAAPLRFCMAVHRMGGHVIVMERFDAEEALANIERFGITSSQWVPTMFIRMLKLPDEVRSKYDVSSLKCAVHAAAPCPAAAKEQMIGWWGPVLHEYYAGTEGNGFCYTNSEDWLEHRGTVGKAIMGQLHICDEDGREVATGEEGTVYFSGASTFEYHNDEAKTADSRLANGWSTLGDIGKVDEDGFLYLTDRKAFMIISGGVNIYPQETENLLTLHPDVVDAAVIGVPNDDFGEEVKAVIQPVTMPASDEEACALERKLIAHCRNNLADVKCPRSIDFQAELPRHPTGKLYKRLLRDEYWKDSDARI